MRLKLLYLLVIVSLVFAKPPAPFGLKLGEATEREFLSLVRDKGWNIEKSGYRIIKGDVSNPSVTGYLVSGLKLDYLSEAYFWFHKGKLFQVEYRFYEDMDKNTFYHYCEQLKAKYGRPSSYSKPWLSNGRALWKFGSIEVELSVPWVSRTTYLTYTHVTLFKQAERSDRDYYRRYMKRKSAATEGL